MGTPQPEVGSAYLLEFPPFPTPVHPTRLKLFHEFAVKGVWLSSASLTLPTDNPDSEASPSSAPHDAQGNALVPISRPLAGKDITFEKSEEARKVKARTGAQKRRAAAGVSGIRLDQEDCWKIGQIGSPWFEPESTSLSNYDVSIPPFNRLLSATRDFLYSRNAEFQYYRNKRLFDRLRDALGLRADIPGSHWPGSGPDGIEYQPPSRLRSRNGDSATQSSTGGTDNLNPPHGEICVLLTKPEVSVRGFLALARREAEAGWRFEPALKLTVITAAFLSFLLRHSVLSEPSLTAALQRAADMARSAPQHLVNAKDFEEILSRGDGWNRACWTVYGGAYGGAERGGLEREDVVWGTPSEAGITEDMNQDADEQGWTVDPVTDDRPKPLTSEEASIHVLPLLQPIGDRQIKLLQYIPYSRRRVVDVLPPLEHAPQRPRYASHCSRLVTVPAPWTPDERWRFIQPNLDGDQSDEEEDSALTFDEEQATIAEPEELVLWVELTAMQRQGFQSEQLIGMGLRGRWGVMGTSDGSFEDHHQWWTFKAKDYVLPSFWQADP